jgi:tyrosyl-tRNA synthetase
MGRQVQRRYGQLEQDILTVPILEGVDGIKKMSKSYGNYIALDEDPKNILGKIMSIPDNLIIKYLELCTDISWNEIKEIENKILSNQLNPRDAKLKLGYEIIKMYHSEMVARETEDFFIKTFQKKEVPDDVAEIKITSGEELSEVLFKNNFVKSKSDFKRLIDEGAITRLEKNESVNDYHFKLTESETLKVGKKRFIRIVIK